MTIDEEMRQFGRELAKNPPDPKLSMDEAISILTEHTGDKYTSPGTKFRSAIKLGIEALKQIQRIRIIEGNPDICLLIGER